MIQLPQIFTMRMEKQLGPEAPAFFACYEQPPRRGLRVNGLRLTPQAFETLSPFALAPSGILPEGFLLAEDAPAIGSHPYHLAGLFYLQEPSAMAPIAALSIRPGMRVLDLCAAPGGKSGGIAALLAGRGLLVANELAPGRAKTLRYNLERLGVTNAAVTCSRPDALCEALAGFFDAVLVDAPCSGEGMFRKDPNAIAEWSPAHVLSCAQRQKAILESAAIAVAEGGLLVYSTCTFSPEENEGVVEAFCTSHKDFSLLSMQRLYPHTCRGEGHFVARLQRAGAPAVEKAKPQRLTLPPCKEAAYRNFCAEALAAPPPGEAVLLRDGRVLALAEALPKGLERARLLSAGVYAGDMVNGRFRPSHALAMATGVEWRQTLPLEEEALSAYLRGQVIPAAGLQGWCRAGVDGYPLGLGKAVEGMLKNHLPKGLRQV